MSAEGIISVSLAVADGRVADVAIVSTRPPRAARALAGRSPDEAIRLAPLLFPLCGVAHGVACARAIEAALGAPAEPRLEVARDLVCLGEAALSHVWQLALAWPEAAGAPPDLGAVRAAQHAQAMLSAALFGARPIFTRLRADLSLDDARAATDALAALVDDLTAGEAALITAVTHADRAAFGARGAGRGLLARLGARRAEA
ncbi:MAG TPA: hypothetical protein VLT33_13145, partial [Labilithrix sp.]|nr:hypothetical protein [Labilithrix sp.]